MARTAIQAAPAGSGLDVASCGRPGGGSPVEEGAEPLLPFLARPPLGYPARRLGAVRPLEHEPFGMACGAGAGGAELVQDSPDRGAEIVRDLVHEAHSQRRLRVEALPGDEVSAGCAFADLPQREGRDHGRDDSELHLREREHRPRLRDHDVAARDEPDAAAEGVSLDEGDDRRRAAVDRLEHPPHGIRVGDVRLQVEIGRGAHPFDVGAGAEAWPLAGEHDRAGRPYVDERLGELGDQGRIECVARLGPGERDSEDVVLPLDAKRAHGGQPKVSRVVRLHGTIAAAATPLREGGVRLDEDAFGPYADFLVGAGLDGILAFGTNGEAVLLSVDERRRGLELWLEGVAGRALVAAHCGAQTTADTVALAAHAAESGADAVAVIGPPYFKLDPAAQEGHLLAAATACAPLPFYVYEFAATAGYAFDQAMLARLRAEADNVVGMKVSDSPWDAFARYLLDGFDIFVGPEALIHRGREAGAVGAVSALASAFPEEVAAVVRESTEEGAARLARLRERMESFPRHAALKRVAGWKGVPLRPDVRPPLRDLDSAEVAELEAWLAAEVGARTA